MTVTHTPVTLYSMQKDSLIILMAFLRWIPKFVQFWWTLYLLEIRQVEKYVDIKIVFIKYMGLSLMISQVLKCFTIMKRIKEISSKINGWWQLVKIFIFFIFFFLLQALRLNFAKNSLLFHVWKMKMWIITCNNYFCYLDVWINLCLGKIF